MTSPNQKKKTKAKAKASRRTHRPRRHLFALEPRFLFDGAAAVTVEQQQQDTTAPHPDAQHTDTTESTSVAADQLVKPGTADVSKSSLTDLLTSAPEKSTSPAPSGGELVFVDSAVRNSAELLKGISPDAQVIFIEAGQDGIQRISEVLAGRENIQAIHIISHGTDGAVKLGNLWLQESNLDQHANAIAEWGKALGSDADVLIYGCNVAATDSGRSLVDALANLTGADVAASEDPTGHADKGGDWKLEYATGAIEASILVTQSAQLEWVGLLAPGVTVSPISGPTTEAGGTATFSVVLDEVPTADVYIPISSSDTTEGTVSTTQLVFTTLDWSTPQVVTVTGVDDSQPDGDVNFTVVTGDPTSADAGYDALTAANVADVSVTNTDNDRVQSNVIALYTFEEGSGATINDVAGTNLALTINDTGNVTWQNGALTVDINTTADPTIAQSAAGVNEVYTRIVAAQEFTVEAWIENASGLQQDPNPPHRLVTLSADTGNRNFSLLYSDADESGGALGNASAYNGRVRTDSGDLNGSGNLVSTPTNSATSNLQHVVMTVDAAGNRTLYIDGVQQGPVVNAGLIDYASWNSNYQLALFNELSYASGGPRGWNGTMHLAAVYDRALTLAEVQRNYTAGADINTLVVDTASDVLDGDVTSLEALLNDRGADGFISLREAITAANNTAGANTITFNIAGAGVQTINVSSPLPDISDTVILDASTQPGFSGTPLIELSGDSAGAGVSGLTTSASGSTIRGFIVNGFTDVGIRLDGTGGNTIVGNFVGTNAAGTLAHANGSTGIEVNSPNNIIGGTTAADRNLVSGNAADGISFNTGADNSFVWGNYVGTDITGTASLGNGGEGVDIDSAAVGISIGGTAAGEGNVIAFNASAGVIIEDPGTANIAVRGNQIFSNGGIGIELNGTAVPGGDGVTANDLGDGDGGPNYLQNYPGIDSAVASGGTVIISGHFSNAADNSRTKANSTYSIDFYANPAAATGREGRTYLGSVSVTTDANGDATFTSAPLDFTGYAVGDRITATATMTASTGGYGAEIGSTSEFSASLGNAPLRAIEDGDAESFLLGCEAFAVDGGLW